MAMSKATTVEEYLAQLPEAARERFEELYAVAKAAAGGAKEVIKWGTPAFEGKRILYSIAAFKDHLNVVPTTATLSEFYAEIDALGLTRTDGILQLSLTEPIPADLVRRILERRAWDVEANDARFAV